MNRRFQGSETERLHCPLAPGEAGGARTPPFTARSTAGAPCLARMLPSRWRGKEIKIKMKHRGITGHFPRNRVRSGQPPRRLRGPRPQGEPHCAAAEDAVPVRDGSPALHRKPRSRHLTRKTEPRENTETPGAPPSPGFVPLSPPAVPARPARTCFLPLARVRPGAWEPRSRWILSVSRSVCFTRFSILVNFVERMYLAHFIQKGRLLNGSFSLL